MPCYHPLLAYKSEGKVVFNKPSAFAEGFNLRCGQCIGCRLDYSRQWAVRCVHEAQMHEDNCFITLTFNPEEIVKRKNPYSLDIKEFQKFMHRMRQKYDHKIRFFHCGEYGELNKRPHYHALLFGHDFMDKKLWSVREGHRLYISEELQNLWPYGFSTIGELNFDTAAYCARYIMKKQTGEGAPEHYQHVDEDGVVWDLAPEYCTMSRRNGIGYEWYQKYGWTDCHAHDEIVINGKTIKPPRAYDKWMEQKDEVRWKEIKEKRIEAQDIVYNEYNEELDRLWVREECKQRQIEKLVRNL